MAWSKTSACPAAVFDAQVAATCMVNGVTTLVTHDRDFRCFPGLEVQRVEPA